MKSRYMLTGLLLGAVLLTGCSKNIADITTNTLSVAKNGEIHDVSIEDYSDGNYKVDELQGFIDGEVAAYNEQAGDECIKVDEFLLDGQVARIQLTYDDMKAYNAFNRTNYELKDLADANLSGEFTAVTDGSKVQASSITEEGLKVLVVTDATDIHVAGKVLYYNSGVTKNESTYAATGEEPAVIVFK